MTSQVLGGKVGVVFGVANKRSIAWGIAEAFHREGARLAFNYQGERLKENVEGLAAAMPGSLVVPCDVTKDAEIDAMFAAVQEKMGRLDILVHCVAFAKKEFPKRSVSALRQPLDAEEGSRRRR